MKTKTIIILSIALLLMGCQDAYQRQSVLNPMGVHISNSAQRDVDMVDRAENPMARPSYQEYQEAIKDKKFEPK